MNNPSNDTIPFPNDEQTEAQSPQASNLSSESSSPAGHDDEQLQTAPDYQALKKEVDRYKDLALRSQAELDNYRKRMAREKDEAIRFANTALLERLLPVIDNFELGLQAAQSTSDVAALLQGMQMVQKQLQDFLRDQGVESLETINAVFDPKVHDAISHQPHNEVPDGHIIQQIRKGYKLRERLLRPASVVVSKGKAE